LLTSHLEERRTGPLESFERRTLAGFALAAIAHAILGFYRVNEPGPLLSAAGILLCGALWLRRVRRAPAGALAMPIGLLLVTAGVYSGYTALNVPFVGVVARFCVPLFLVFLGATLLFAEQEIEFQIVPLALAAVAFVIVQIVLTAEARSEAKPIPARRDDLAGSTIVAGMRSSEVARSFVDAINAHDPAAIVALTTADHRFIDSLGQTVAADKLLAAWQSYFRMVPDYRITVTRWMTDDDNVVALGTASGTFTADGTIRAKKSWSTPAAWRAVIRDGKVAEWQVYGGSP